MPTYYLMLKDGITKKSLYFLEESSQKNHNEYEIYDSTRLSPIFPCAPEKMIIPDLKANLYVGFFFYQKAFSILGYLLKQLSDEEQGKVWFSHGLASIIVLSEKKELINKVKDFYTIELRAYEIWTIKKHILEKTEPWLCDLTNFDKTIFEIIDYSKLPYDLFMILEQFKNSMKTAISKSAQYIPSQLIVYQRIINAVNEILEELIFLHNPKSKIPQSLKKLDIESLRKNLVEQQKMINQRTGHLVQINSVLSYVLSQGYSGIVPIFENSCHIRNFSLLGIGTAFCALSAFSRYVEKVFEKFPICSVVDKEYRKIQGVEVFKTITEFDSDAWAIKECSMDFYLNNKKSKKSLPKLVCYSGRQGFRETEFSVTSALQVLYSTDSVPWSMMTVSHELLHAQVRAILSVIFSDTSDKSSEKIFQSFVENFSSFNKKKPQKRRSKLTDSICDIILNYCRNAKNLKVFVENMQSNLNKIVKDGKEKYGLNIFAPNSSELFRVLQSEFNLFNEIIVHVIDYYYFYNCKDRIFLGLLWESWTPVPAVLDSIERYIFRSILAVSSKQTGSLNDRFTISLKTVKEVLQKLNKKNPTNIVISAALDCISDKEVIQRLRLQSIAGIYLVDMTRQFLVSSHIHSALIKEDKNLDNNDDETSYGFTYLLNMGEFPGIKIESPIAFIADRLQRALKRTTKRDYHEEFFAAAWTLLACASALPEEEVNHV